MIFLPILTSSSIRPKTTRRPGGLKFQVNRAGGAAGTRSRMSLWTIIQGSSLEAYDEAYGGLDYGHG